MEAAQVLRRERVLDPEMRWIQFRRRQTAHRKDGEANGEAAAFIHARAFHIDFAAVETDELMGDGKTETEPPVTPRRTAVPLAKTLGNVRQQFRVDSLAAIRNNNRSEVVFLPDSDPDLAAARRKLDRVREEVRDHLFQPHAIAVNQQVVRL